ncbi:uncharacterized protein BCR38DRAFT_407186 [Pseudomassariella vexata]|uniref:NACHT domain-containing protein n=1 Tax=Pseudomassariella vexata TaxID=1141098 RepID=A0A1Y2E6I0_9PEZI|nr:uncharacterized protein BCR38DRAFT_407186 [Pseudomassariella vexata]ORY67183.1 hypothetical protein BCR38DRAFT_407186 [Pseudomassariella vexata]
MIDRYHLILLLAKVLVPRFFSHPGFESGSQDDEQELLDTEDNFSKAVEELRDETRYLTVAKTQRNFRSRIAIVAHKTRVLLQESAEIKHHTASESAQTRTEKFLLTKEIEDLDVDSADQQSKQRLFPNLKYEGMNDCMNLIPYSHYRIFDGDIKNFAAGSDTDENGDESDVHHRAQPDEDCTTNMISKCSYTGQLSLIPRILNTAQHQGPLMLPSPSNLHLRPNIHDETLSAQLILVWKDYDSNGSDVELETTLTEALDTTPSFFCLFIDGLDEVSQEYKAFRLLQRMDTPRSVPNAKLCVSGCPEPAIRRTSRDPRI